MFSILFFIVLILMIIGLFKPSFVKMKSKKQTLKILGTATIVFFILGVATAPKHKEKQLDNTSQTKTETQMTTALPYNILKVEDVSFPGRKRISSFISINDTNPTFEEKAQTVIKAAKDLCKKYNADVVNVVMEASKGAIGKGYSLAICEYAPDGGGYSGDQNWTCKVKSSKNNPTVQQISILDHWYNERDNYQKDGLTDEDSLKAHLASELNIPVEKISLPFIEMAEYSSK
ncbi:DUF4875 domain-containing protein [Maridesulfovibrio bastinii]|uniref:DUF4875 domain-containing protein n=1 Tax=Maridesulfovibrio bastinii TaxID=47157 RepID=UPI0003FDE734|nr:DUF4875 domain-containing protein [Maridesulfovibrio bastinii]